MIILIEIVIGLKLKENFESMSIKKLFFYKLRNLIK